MSGNPPQRHKTMEELTPAEHAERQRTGELPETPEFAAYRAENPDLFAEDGAPRDLDELTIADHVNRKYGGNNR